MRVLIAGCGYLGLALGARLVAAGHQVSGMRRPGSDIAPLRHAGIVPVSADLSIPQTLAGVSGNAWDWVVHCAAPAEHSESGYRAVYPGGARHLLHALESSRPRSFVLVSSTSVYGQVDGSLVDEMSPTEPVGFGGRAMLEAEHVLRDAAAAGWTTVILRAAGLYGPGRNRLAAARRGEFRASGDPSRWMNLIHRDDLAAAIVAAFECARGGTTYNVCDGSHATEAGFLGWIAGRVGAAPPQFAAPMAASTQGRAPTNKRVVGERLRRELGWVPAFPDFRAGYESILAVEHCQQLPLDTCVNSVHP